MARICTLISGPRIRAVRWMASHCDRVEFSRTLPDGRVSAGMATPEDILGLIDIIEELITGRMDRHVIEEEFPAWADELRRRETGSQAAATGDRDARFCADLATFKTVEGAQELTYESVGPRRSVFSETTQSYPSPSSARSENVERE